MVAVQCQTIETPCNKKLETVAVSPFWTEQDRRRKIFQENQSLALAVWLVLHCNVMMISCKIVYFMHVCMSIIYNQEWLKSKLNNILEWLKNVFFPKREFLKILEESKNQWRKFVLLDFYYYLHWNKVHRTVMHIAPPSLFNGKSDAKTL